jgi:hypothetical protein
MPVQNFTVYLNIYLWVMLLYSSRCELFSSNIFKIQKEDSVVGIVPCLWAGRPRGWSLSPVGPRIFSSPRRPDQLWGQPNLLSPGINWPGCEANHLPPASAEVKKMWIYTSTPPYAFMA